jgi:hypothetical protein
MSYFLLPNLNFIFQNQPTLTSYLLAVAAASVGHSATRVIVVAACFSEIIKVSF